MGRRERTGLHNKCGAMPESDDPISGQPDSREHTSSRRKGNSSRGSRRRLRVCLRCRQRPRPPPHSSSGMLTRFPFGARYLHPAVQATGTSTGNGQPFQANRGDFPFPQDRLTRVQLLFTRNPSPLQSSRSSLEYLLLTTKIRTGGRSVRACTTDCTATESTWGPPSPPTTRGMHALFAHQVSGN